MFKISLCFLLTVFLAVALAQKTDLHIVSLALPPYSYEKEGKVGGLACDLGNALAEEAGLTASNREVRVVRAVEEMAQGRADMILMLPTREVEAVAENLGPILPMETVVLGRKGMNFSRVEDLKGRTVASVRGARYDERVTPENGITIYSTNNYIHGLKLLLGNRVDAVVGPRFGLEYAIRENRLRQDRFGKPLVLNVNNVCVFLSKRVNPEVADQLRAAMARMESKGTVEKILSGYDPQYR